VTAELALFQKRGVWCSPAWNRIYGNTNRFFTDSYNCNTKPKYTQVLFFHKNV